MGMKDLVMRAAMRYGAMSAAQKKTLVMVPIAVVAPVVLTAESCWVVDNFDVAHITGEHVDFYGDFSAWDWLCVGIEGNVYASCWPKNWVWYHIDWYRKEYIYTFDRGYHWSWEYNGGGWYSWPCKVWVWNTFGDAPGSDCYKVNGVQLW